MKKYYIKLDYNRDEIFDYCMPYFKEDIISDIKIKNDLFVYLIYYTHTANYNFYTSFSNKLLLGRDYIMCDNLEEFKFSIESSRMGLI